MHAFCVCIYVHVCAAVVPKPHSHLMKRHGENRRHPKTRHPQHQPADSIPTIHISQFQQLHLRRPPRCTTGIAAEPAPVIIPAWGPQRRSGVFCRVRNSDDGTSCPRATVHSHSKDISLVPAGLQACLQPFSSSAPSIFRAASWTTATLGLHTVRGRRRFSSLLMAHM